MPAGHPFSSSKKVGAGLAALILLVMAGCSATGSLAEIRANLKHLDNG